MARTADLDILLRDIMDITDLKMGGATAGILGTVSAESEIVNKLKQSAVAFASEYRKPAADHAVIEQLSNELYGYLQTLQLTNTLSEETVTKLTGQLERLTDKLSD